MKKFFTHPLVILLIILTTLNMNMALNQASEDEKVNAEPDQTTLPQIIRDRSNEPSLYVPKMEGSKKSNESA